MKQRLSLCVATRRALSGSSHQRLASGAATTAVLAGVLVNSAIVTPTLAAELPEATVFNAAQRLDALGTAIASGKDVNGDGIDDLLVGAPGVSPDETGPVGEAYLVFGASEGLPATFDVASLRAANGGDGTRGVVLKGTSPGDEAGLAVSLVPDMNGDGLAELAVGATVGLNGRDLGRAYVLFGRSTAFPPEIVLNDLLPEEGGDGSTGFVVSGTDADDLLGTSLASAGDMNQDGLGDLLIGAPGAAVSPDSNAGEAYVIYGSDAGFPAEIIAADLKSSRGGDGTMGFALLGVNTGARNGLFGYSMADAADVNGDGLDDLVIGAIRRASDAGEIAVIFGSMEGFGAEFDVRSLLPQEGNDGSLGAVFAGATTGEQAGISLATGDINGDGMGDIVIGAEDSPAGGIQQAGRVYIVLGNEDGFAPDLNLGSLLVENGGDGSVGVVLNGSTRDGYAGSTVVVAADLNGDGVDEVMTRDRGDGGASSPALSYVVFGSASGLPTEFELADLREENGNDGSMGFTVAEADVSDRIAPFGTGDLNSDGFNDLLFGAPEANAGGRIDSGESYTLFGSSAGFGSGIDLSTIVPAEPFSATIFGADLQVAVCRNQTTQQSVAIPLPEPRGNDFIDCEGAGLAISPGDALLLIAVGISVDDQVPEGSVFRVPRNSTVVCRNLTEPDTALARVGADGRFNCADAQLRAVTGDRVLAVIVGTAE